MLDTAGRDTNQAGPTPQGAPGLDGESHMYIPNLLGPGKAHRGVPPAPGALLDIQWALDKG